jgi:hypothetical protein
MAKKAASGTPLKTQACDWHASHCVKVMLGQIFGEN